MGEMLEDKDIYIERIDQRCDQISIGKIVEPGERILIDIPAEGNYIEIMGHKIDGFESFEAFLEYLKKVAEIECENQVLNDNWNKLKKFLTKEEEKIWVLKSDILSKMREIEGENNG